MILCGKATLTKPAGTSLNVRFVVKRGNGVLIVATVWNVVLLKSASGTHFRRRFFNTACRQDSIFVDFVF